MNVACTICNKPLSDPISVDLGIGPVCRVSAKNHREMSENLFAPRAEYGWDVIGDVLCIEDLNGAKSVTNDMENILRDLLHDISMPRKIIYKDSMGVWDGVDFTNGMVRFYSLNERRMEDALAKVGR